MLAEDKKALRLDSCFQTNTIFLLPLLHLLEIKHNIKIPEYYLNICKNQVLHECEEVSSGYMLASII